MDNVRMVYVTSSWCGPCKVVRPLIHELIAVGWDIEIMDADDNRDFVMKNQISSIPTFLIYRDNIQVQRFTGARDKKAILSALQRAAE